MDYSLRKALNHHATGLPLALVFYDVMCQFWVKFRKRVDQSPYLSVPEGLAIRRGIGLFHVHGHQDSCFSRFAPNFIEGAGQVDGEVIETLWAPIDKLAPMVRGMGTAYRREILDDHMNTSNWLKMIGIGAPLTGSSPQLSTDLLAVPALLRRWKRAVHESALASESFDALSAGLDEELLLLWKSMDAKAQAARDRKPSAMDIYDMVAQKCKCHECNRWEMHSTKHRSAQPSYH